MDRVESSSARGPELGGASPAGRLSRRRGPEKQSPRVVTRRKRPTRGTSRAASSKTTTSLPPPPPQLLPLSDFPLVRDGHLSPADVVDLFAFFFSRVYAVIPLPGLSSLAGLSSESEVAAFAAREPHLAAAVLVCATAFLQDGEALHLEAWTYFMTLHNALLAGEGLSVGAVEALLLLVEYPLRIPHSAATPETHLSGMLASAAVRVATSLGLDKIPLQFCGKAKAADQRGRLVWVLARQLDVLEGKGSLVFEWEPREQPTTFGVLADDMDADTSSFLEAQFELAGIVTELQDRLHPLGAGSVRTSSPTGRASAAHTASLALDFFRGAWGNTKWKTHLRSEIVWLTMHASRCQVYVHDLVPDGLVHSPQRTCDALFPFVDAASDLLQLVTSRLQDGSLQYLPARCIRSIAKTTESLLTASSTFPYALDWTPQLALVRVVIDILADAAPASPHSSTHYARTLETLWDSRKPVLSPSASSWSSGSVSAASPIFDFDDTSPSPSSSSSSVAGMGGTLSRSPQLDATLLGDAKGGYCDEKYAVGTGAVWDDLSLDEGVSETSSWPTW